MPPPLPAIVGGWPLSAIDSISGGRFGVNESGWQKPSLPTELGIWPGDVTSPVYDLTEYVQVLRDLMGHQQRFQRRLLHHEQLLQSARSRRCR